jgi:hypothetical protein
MSEGSGQRYCVNCGVEIRVGTIFACLAGRRIYYEAGRVVAENRRAKSEYKIHQSGESSLMDYLAALSMLF